MGELPEGDRSFTTVGRASTSAINPPIPKFSRFTTSGVVKRDQKTQRLQETVLTRSVEAKSVGFAIAHVVALVVVGERARANIVGKVRQRIDAG